MTKITVKSEKGRPLNPYQPPNGDYIKYRAFEANVKTNLLTKPKKWPWAKAAWKPKNQKQDYIRAGALYQAEIDRLQRLCLNDAALYMQSRLSQIECEIRINSINK